MSICLEIFVRTGQKNVQTGWNSRKKGELCEPCIKAGAFRKAFVLDVRGKEMGVPMNEHFLSPNIHSNL